MVNTKCAEFSKADRTALERATEMEMENAMPISDVNFVRPNATTFLASKSPSAIEAAFPNNRRYCSGENDSFSVCQSVVVLVYLLMPFFCISSSSLSVC